MKKHILPLLILALLGGLPVVQAEELGRLFFTPEQRTLLDTQQISGQSVESATPSYIIVNGVVQKRGGNRIVWINGAPQAAGKSNERTPATVPVAVPGKTEPVQLKVGQRLMLEAPAQDAAQSPAPNPADETKSAPQRPTDAGNNDD